MKGLTRRLLKLVTANNTEIAELANFVPCTPSMLYACLRDEKNLSAEKIERVAKYFNVSPGWLLFGGEYMIPKIQDQFGKKAEVAKDSRLCILPVIDLGELKNWKQIKEGFTTMKAENIEAIKGKKAYQTTDPRYFSCVPIEIKGDMMIDHTGRHVSLYPGMVGLISLDCVGLKSGDYVIAEPPGFDGAIIRQYIEEAGNHYLIALNGKYPTITIQNIDLIIGRLVKLEYVLP